MSKPRFLPKFPVFVQDWFSSMRVRAMTLEQRGAYMELLLLQWQEGALPASAEALLRLAGLRGSPEEHALVLEAFPVDADGQRRNAKCAQVRAEAEAFCDAQAEKGQRSGEARRAKAANRGATGDEPETNRGSTVVPSGSNPAGTQVEPSGNPAGTQSNPPTPTPTPTPISDSELRSPHTPPAEAGPPPPPPEAAPAKAKRERVPEWKGTIPMALAGDRFAAAWARWMKFRRTEKRKPITQISGDQALAKLAEWGVKRACEAIEHTIAMGWQGIQEPRPEPGGSKFGPQHGSPFQRNVPDDLRRIL